MAFTNLERRIANLVGRSPVVRQQAKRAYQYLNYYLLRERGFTRELDRGCDLRTPEDWAGVGELPGETLFGYYDKSPWSCDGRYFLLHSLRSRDRSCPVDIVALDGAESRTIVVGGTTAWNFQQGAMLQWLHTASEPLVVFNDFQDADLVARIARLDGAELQRLPRPVQALHAPSGVAASINVNALLDNRVDYAYTRRARNLELTVDRDGLVLMDLATGESTLRTSLAWFIGNRPRADMEGTRHWLNHAMFSPSGRDIVLMHRWGDSRRRLSRLYRVPIATGEPSLLLDHGMVSHYHWLDDQRLIVYAQADTGIGYHVIDTNTARSRPIRDLGLEPLGDGHPTVSAASGLVAIDTYPDRRGVQSLHVFDPDDAAGALRSIVRVAHPPAFHGLARCDLHPRWHPREPLIAIDSVLSGRRRCWIIECGNLFAPTEPARLDERGSSS
ncbi:MAG: hypothetical protein RBT60_04750 [Candidatus Krumholzibacteria bacterium]|jgi:hypothetical protein|nr:hypothetical protein [Candidatus Krumholzibacteria bacterium]